jgi:hypothetical protein
VQKFLAGFTISWDKSCSRPRRLYSAFGPASTFTRASKEEVGERRASANSVVAHDEQFGVAFLHCLSVELQRSLIKPSRSGFQVVLEREPDVGKLLNLLIVRLAQVYYVGYSERFQLPCMRLGFNCASEREPFAHEESFHRLGPLSIPNRPRRLENLYFVNAVLVPLGPLN